MYGDMDALDVSGVSACNHSRRARGLDYAVNYSVCPHQACPPVPSNDDYPDLCKSVKATYCEKS